jgi:glycosyltransferase involved in cell wall biosynthesis
MAMRLSVSAVIPAYNRERFIGDAIDSVLRQERPVDEVIVVDDGSTDGTADIAASFAGVQVVRLPETRGTSGARNAAVAAARGNLLAWLDSDDVWLPDHTATVVSLMERHPSAVVGFTNAEYFGDREGVWPLPDVPEDEPFDALDAAFKRTISTMSPALTRREAVLAVDGFDESLRSSVDFDLFLRLSLQGPFVCSRRVTTRYRWHGDQISARPFAQLKAMYAARTKLLQFLAQSGQHRIAADLRERLLECVHSDLWAAWDRKNPSSLRAIVELAHELQSQSVLERPFSPRSLNGLGRYCEERGQLQSPALHSPGAPYLFGRPRWLYRPAIAAEVRYRWARLTKPKEVWLGYLMEAANSRGRIKGAR